MRTNATIEVCLSSTAKAFIILTLLLIQTTYAAVDRVNGSNQNASGTVSQLGKGLGNGEEDEPPPIALGKGLGNGEEDEPPPIALSKGLGNGEEDEPPPIASANGPGNGEEDEPPPVTMA